MVGAAITFALDVPPGSLAAIRKHTGLPRPRSAAVTLTWLDTADGARARAGRTWLSWREGRRSGLRDLPVHGDDTDSALLADSATAAEHPADCVPVCRFTGRRYFVAGDALSVVLLEGRLEAGVAQCDLARVLLAGPADAVAAFARLCPGGRLPRGGVSAVALALAGLIRPEPPAALPALDAEMTLSAAIAAICRHFAALLLAQAPDAMAGASTEPVHQMRVAVRRLRSALRLARRDAPCAELTALAEAARGLGHALAPARDWDVFLAGLGTNVAAAFPDERPIARMLAAARRQHRDAYADLRAHLADDAFRLLVLDLALAASCAPWDAAEGAEPRGLARFAAVALTRQWRRLLAPGRNLDGLAEARLHEIRIEAKRMRYAAELFAPLFPRRESARLMARLKTVQDLLGHLNDGATARSLMARLGGTGQGFAGGAVHGFVAAAGGAQRPGIEEAWRRLRKAPVFWT